MPNTSTPNNPQLHQLALTAGAIGYLVEKIDTINNDSKPHTPQTESYRSKKVGTARAAMVNDLFDAYIATLNPAVARTVRDHSTPWKTWLAEGHHLRVTRGEPNLGTDRAASFNKGVNTLGSNDLGALFPEELLGGAPMQNLTYSTPNDPLNVWIKYTPTSSGSITKCIYYTSMQGESFSFLEEISLIEIISFAEELEQEQPDWLALLYSEYDHLYNETHLNLSTTSAFDGAEKVTPTEIGASEKAALQDREDLENKAS